MAGSFEPIQDIPLRPTNPKGNQRLTTLDVFRSASSPRPSPPFKRMEERVPGASSADWYPCAGMLPAGTSRSTLTGGVSGLYLGFNAV